MSSKLVISILVACLYQACTNTPVVEAALPLSPQQSAVEERVVKFMWDSKFTSETPLNDWVFSVEASVDPNFTSVAFSCTTKVWSWCEAPLSAFKSGTIYWRVSTRYQASSIDKWQQIQSTTMSFTYAGNDGAVHVDPSTVSVKALGTQLHPVKTIAEAFYVASQRKLTKVYLANNGAAYTEAIPQLTGYSVKGCYAPSTWVRNTGTCTTTLSDGAATTYYDILN